MVYPPRVIFIHAGVNNLSQPFLFENEYHQMSIAMRQLDNLGSTLRRLSEKSLDLRVIVSSVIKTRDDFINARSVLINDQMKFMCVKNSWFYMDNSNIDLGHLKDNVHLNEQGQQALVKNFYCSLCSL